MTPAIERMMVQLQLTQLASQQLAMQCGILLEELDSALTASKTAAAPPPPPAETECPHPKEFRDYSARTMGNPDRFLCQKCGDLVNGTAS